MKLLGTTLLLLALPYSVFAQTFSTPVKVNGTTAAHSPMIQTSRNGDLYVAWYANAADIWFARSVDSGKTFTAPIRVSQEVTSNIYTSMLQRTPRFIVDTKGTIHMAWTEERVNGQNDVWYVQSTNRGDTWTQPVSIMDPDDSATYPQDFCNIACDSSDNLYVAYLDFRGVVRGDEDFAQLHLTKSIDGGVHWSVPVVANKFRNGVGGTCECCKLDIAATASGEIDIAFRSNINDKRDIWLARSHDRGVTFDSTIRIQTGTWTISACPTTGQSIALDRFDNLHLGWCDSRDDSNKSIGYYSLLPAGQNEIFVNRATSRPGLQNVNWPSIAVSRVMGGIAYLYQAGSSPRLRFTYSADGGNSWSQDMPTPDVLGGQQSLGVPVFLGTDLFAVWQEGPSAGSIYISNITNLPPPKQVVAAQPQIETDPSEPSQALRISWLPTSGPFIWYGYAVESMVGDTVWSGVTRDTSVTVPALEAGTYMFTLTTNSSVSSSSDSQKFTRADASVAEHSGAALLFTLDGYQLRFTLPQDEAATITIFDILGREVSQQRGVGAIGFERSALTPGCYEVRITSNLRTEVFPIVIQ